MSSLHKSLDTELESTTDLTSTLEELDSWLAEMTREPKTVDEVIERLIGLTLPDPIWEAGQVLASPFRENFDAQCWFWNRAAYAYLQANHRQEALEVWASLYLATLSLQQRYRCRIHKGMSLGNLGYALFDRLGRHKVLQAKCWSLGIVEDVFSNPSGYQSDPNFRNLLLMNGVTSASLQQLGLMVEKRFLDSALILELPERCIEYWFHPLLNTPTQECLLRTEELLSKLEDSYPNLPEPGRRLAMIEHAWGFADWTRMLGT